MYKECVCATLGNTFVSVGQVGINFSSVNQPVVLLVQLNVQENGRRKIATAWAQFGATERINVYKNACATLGNTFVSVGQVGINFSSFW
jgi:hypothetical protein